MVILPTPLPQCVRLLAADRSAQVVWQNELGGVTFELGAGADCCFLKWSPRACPIDLSRERRRLEWAVRWVRVPRVLDYGSDAEGTWLVTRGLSGQCAVAERWLREPALAVAAIGAGLRALHDALPVAECPFSWSLDDRIADAQRRAELEQLPRARWHADHHHLSVREALELVACRPTIDRLVVCHGDTCAPNTLIDEDGTCSGHVDLGCLGVADRWADLAIATWSTQWNYGPGWEGAVLAAYGIEPDEARTRYYRLLWDLGP